MQTGMFSYLLAFSIWTFVRARLNGVCTQHRMRPVSRERHRWSERTWALDRHFLKFGWLTSVPEAKLTGHDRKLCLGARDKIDTGPDRKMELPCSSRQAGGQRGHWTQRWRAGLEQLRSSGNMSCLLDPAGVRVLLVGKLPREKRWWHVRYRRFVIFVPCEWAEPPAGQFAWKAGGRTASTF